MSTAPISAPAVVRGPSSSPLCGECPLAKNGIPQRPVPGIGPADPKFIILGEGPGQQEVKDLVPFVGVSGNLLNQALEKTGVDRDRDVWVTNATLCQLPHAASDAVRKKARECCNPRLLVELAEYPTLPLLALGGTACKALLGDKFSVSAMAGALHEVDGRDVIPTIHPAAILRGGSVANGDLLVWNLIYDVAKVKRLASGDEVKFTDDIQIEFTDAGKANDLILGILPEIDVAKFLSFDLEAVDEDPSRPVNAPVAFFSIITAIGIGTLDRAVSVPWAMLTPGTKEAIKKRFADPTITKVGQNSILYDEAVLNRYGFEVNGPHEDLMLMHHNAFPGLPHDLQRVVTQFWATRGWKAEFRRGEAARAEEEDLDDDSDIDCEVEVDEEAVAKATLAAEEFHFYNGKDCLTTGRTIGKVFDCVSRIPGAETTYEIDVAMAKIAKRMHLVGIPYSKEVNADLAKRFGAFVAEALKQLNAKAAELESQIIEHLAYEKAKVKRLKDPPGFADRIEVRKRDLAKKIKKKGGFKFNPNSKYEVPAFLKAQGINLVMETKSGMISTKKDILNAHAHRPPVQAILDYRKNQKALSTFVIKIPRLVDRNWRLHVIWSVNKITSRWGGDNPAIQNLSEMRDREPVLNLRRQVVAPPGMKFTAFDYDGQEARGVGLFARCKYIIETFAEFDRLEAIAVGGGKGKDLHTKLTKEWAAAAWEAAECKNTRCTDPRHQGASHHGGADAQKFLRNMTKRVEYAWLYMAGDQTIHHTILTEFPEVTLGDVQKLTRLFARIMPEVPAWHREVLVNVAREKQVVGIGGKHRHYPLGNADPNEAINFFAQELGAYLMRLGLIDFAPQCYAIPDAEIILQLHDSLVTESWAEDALAIRALYKKCFPRTLVYRGASMFFPIDVGSEEKPKIEDSWDKL